MMPDFHRALEGILRRTDPRPVQQESHPALGAVEPGTASKRRRQWFSNLATKTIMPLLDKVAETAREHGASANSRLAEVDGQLAAELVILRGFLPKGARPPRLAVYAVEGERPLMVEYTGTFPHVGAIGGFGAEIDFDPIYPEPTRRKDPRLCRVGMWYRITIEVTSHPSSAPTRR